MRVLILGGGAREHALAWRISQSPQCSSLFVWPGNGGTKQLRWNVCLNPDRLIDHIVALRPDYVVIGPETFLQEGLVDKLAERGIPAFGPSQAAAQLETSKSFALKVMQEAHVPHPGSWVFSNPQAVVTFATTYKKPVVVKADGLTGGKGVWLCHTLEEVERYANLCWELHPEEPIVVQELLEGQEVSVFAFTDGHNISSMVAARDYKRAFDGDRGPNTGGMGSYAWPYFWTTELEQEILEWIIRPIIRRMEMRGTPFAGVLYAGLMLTKEGPKVLEFNARLGDPEAQVILPLLETDFLEVCKAVYTQTLNQCEVRWRRDKSCVGVVIASNGYPEQAVPDAAVEGLSKMDPEILVFHGGNSGRLMTIVGRGASVPEARDYVYSNLGLLHLQKAFFREDIAALTEGAS